MKDDPIKCEFSLIHTTADTYLGDVINEEGCEMSITETIEARIKKQKNKVEEIIQLADHLSPKNSISFLTHPPLTRRHKIID